MPLKYTGNEEGVPFVMGVPARDLSDDDLDELAGGRLGKDKAAVRKSLVKSGVYAEGKPEAHKPTKPDKPDEE
jgi:hypothetical protein